MLFSHAVVLVKDVSQTHDISDSIELSRSLCFSDFRNVSKLGVTSAAVEVILPVWRLAEYAECLCDIELVDYVDDQCG